MLKNPRPRARLGKGVKSDSLREAAASFHNTNVLEHLKSRQEERFFAQDVTMLAVTDALIRCMKSSGISQADLAARIGKSRSHVSQVLSGRRNMTLTTLADILWACRHELRDLVLSPLGQSEVSKERMDAFLDTSFRAIATVEPKSTFRADSDKPFHMVFPTVGVARGELLGA